MKLHNYFRSSASYRVRIALNLKGLAYDYLAVHLRRNGGEQFAPDFLPLNPQQLVPVLDTGEHRLTQSLAIIEYLDETYPEPPLLPRTPWERARVRALALVIACEVHPLNNLRVLDYLAREFGANSQVQSAWYQHWVALGLGALEAQVAGSPHTGQFCHGDRPGLADCCLIPQLFNARRFNCDLTAYPTLLGIERNCNALAAFRDAAPDSQPDAEV
ncbi:MAG TPA: maleylacetoacetate isomerase [Polyangiaceae bacterium]|nr:maleylacetoacetate isomerase [Polyangiaceae bacterium]